MFACGSLHVGGLITLFEARSGECLLLGATAPPSGMMVPAERPYSNPEGTMLPWPCDSPGMPWLPSKKGRPVRGVRWA